MSKNPSWLRLSSAVHLTPKQFVWSTFFDFFGISQCFDYESFKFWLHILQEVDRVIIIHNIEHGVDSRILVGREGRQMECRFGIFMITLGDRSHAR